MKRTVWLPVLFVCSLSLFAQAAELTKIEPVSIETERSVVFFTTEIADTPETRERGLMFRHKLPQDHAMLFDFQPPRPAAMWMKNTNISLDMLFIRPDGSIAAIAENTVPRSLDVVSVAEPVKGVLEVPAGTVKRLGIKMNNHVYHRIFTIAN